MHKKILLYVLVVIVLFALPIYTIVVSMDTLKGGNEFLFKVRAFDPYDMFRGNYINISFKEKYADSSNIENGVYGKKYFVTIGTDDEGYAYFADAFCKNLMIQQIIMKQRHTFTMMIRSVALRLPKGTI